MPSCSICELKHFWDVETFCTWLFQQKNALVLAHNASGFDSIFIQNFIQKNTNFIKSTTIVNGTKILLIETEDLRIIDSLSFIPIPLCDFPKTFGITELKKGFFPHKFNKQENFSYIGTTPDKSFYGVEHFSNKKLEEFNIWYESVKDQVFDFKKEILEYCRDDTDLLMKGILAFKNLILDITKTATLEGIEPFETSLTLAGLCQFIFRRNFLKPKILPFIPEFGYKNHSNNSIEWLHYLMSKNENLHIKHARNGGEHRIKGLFVDGYDEKTDTIYEFAGCYWHSCPKCFPHGKTFNNTFQTTSDQNYEKYLSKKNILIANCKNYIEIWEHEWNIIKNNFKTDTVPGIRIRDALFGGRTNAFTLFYEIEDNEEIHYVDFTSLYPAEMKNRVFPVGSPIYMYENLKKVDLSKILGLIKLKILPPKNLLLPLLPQKSNDKLMFTLCKKCASSLNKNYCNHTDEERAITGTWVSLEVQKAIQLGYKVLKVYEIIHFPESQLYDPISKTGGIFTEYINIFLKGKQEASGYPGDCETEKDKEKYIQEYFDIEGIRLDPKKIEFNAGKRFICKIFLNAFWGRLAMNPDKTSYRIVRKAADWFKLVSDDTKIIKSFNVLSEEAVEVFYSNKVIDNLTDTSLIHGCFVTAHGRLDLYKEMEKLGDRLLYVDTDSLFYRWKPKQYKPVLGRFLGDLTNELKSGEFITCFISAGPKNYSYITNKSKENITVKGFRLSHSVQKHINFESVKNMVLKDQNKIIRVSQLKFSRSKTDWSVTTSSIDKDYGFCYDKRIILSDLSTIPYGYETHERQLKENKINNKLYNL